MLSFKRLSLSGGFSGTGAFWGVVRWACAKECFLVISGLMPWPSGRWMRCLRRFEVGLLGLMTPREGESLFQLLGDLTLIDDESITYSFLILASCTFYLNAMTLPDIWVLRTWYFPPVTMDIFDSVSVGSGSILFINVFASKSFEGEFDFRLI